MQPERTQFERIQRRFNLIEFNPIELILSRELLVNSRS